MGLKQRSEKFFRGWFPKEPYLPKASATNNLPDNPPQIPYPTGSTLSATKFMAVFTVFWGAMCYFTIFGIANHMPLTFQIAWITTGLTIGCVTSVFVTRRQLKQLTRNNQLGIDAKDMLLSVLPISIFVVPVFALGWVGHNLDIASGCLLTVQACVASIFAIRAVMFLQYERSRNISIRQYWLQSGFFVFPKSRANSNNRLSDNACQRVKSVFEGE